MASKASRVDAAERMMNLIALLTESSEWLTLEQIVNRMSSWYSGSAEGIRTTFERDKKVLRDVGLPIVTKTLGGADAGKTAYSIDRSVYRVFNFGLTADELTALQEAAATVQMGTSWGRQAVQWLGGEVPPADSREAARVVAGEPVLPRLWSAVADNRSARFSYHGRDRHVHPYGLLARNGFWYLIAFDPSRDARVTYRVDRIDGDVTIGEAREFERPAEFSLESGYTRDPKVFPGGDDEVAVVRVSPVLASVVVRELGAESVVATMPDGSVDVRVPCGNRIAFKSWLFAMVDRAVVMSPPALRGEIEGELESMAGGAR